MSSKKPTDAAAPATSTPTQGLKNFLWVNDFTQESARSFCQDLLTLENGLRPETPIIVYVDSYGGAVDAAIAMYDMMNFVNNPIITVCVGKAMSCGAFLLAAGDYRVITPNSRVMIHDISTVSWGKIADIVNDATESTRLSKQFMTILAKNCDKSYKQLMDSLHNNKNADLYFTAEGALKYGIVDKIACARPAISTLSLTKRFKKKAR